MKSDSSLPKSTWVSVVFSLNTINSKYQNWTRRESCNSKWWDDKMEIRKELWYILIDRSMKWYHIIVSISNVLKTVSNTFIRNRTVSKGKNLILTIRESFGNQKSETGEYYVVIRASMNRYQTVAPNANFQISIKRSQIWKKNRNHQIEKRKRDTRNTK